MVTNLRTKYLQISEEYLKTTELIHASIQEARQFAETEIEEVKKLAEIHRMLK